MACCFFYVDVFNELSCFVKGDVVQWEIVKNLMMNHCLRRFRPGCLSVYVVEICLVISLRILLFFVLGRMSSCRCLVF